MGLFDIFKRPSPSSEAIEVFKPTFTKEPIKPVASKDLLRKILDKPLSEMERGEIIDNLIDRFKNGTLPVGIYRHNQTGDISNQLLPDQQQLLPNHFFEVQGRGEGAIMVPQLVAGYELAKSVLSPKAYEAFINGDCGVQRNGGLMNEIEDTHETGANFRDAARKQGIAVETKVVDLYLPSQKNSNAELAGQKDIPVTPLKCIIITILNDRKMLQATDNDPRMSTLRFTILVGRTNNCPEKFEKSPQERGKLDYPDYLRALKADPIIFLRALKQVVPQAFTLKDGSNYLPPGVPARVGVFADELDAIRQ